MKQKLKISLLLILVWTISLWLPGVCRAAELGPDAENRHVIIDTDMGADDASAILLALKSGAFKIEGITVLAGNVSLQQAARNALATLEIARADIPVYMGAEKALSGDERELFSVYGKDGMGDADLIHPNGKPQQ